MVGFSKSEDIGRLSKKLKELIVKDLAAKAQRASKP